MRDPILAKGAKPHKFVIVAIGSNLPGQGGRSPLDTCIWAADRLARLPGLHLVAGSRWFASAAHPPAAQPDYVNGVVRLSGTADPEPLLESLQAIEAEAGRVRSVPNAARTLDLDLLALDDLIMATERLVLPHPRLHQRAFVLRPLLDAAPTWHHPLLRRDAAAMLAACPDAGSANPLPSSDRAPI